MQVPKENRIDIGYRVGKLTVQEKTDQRKNQYVVWRCKCDCGGEILLDTRYLQRATVTDCGCEGKVGPKERDLTGMRFGKLVGLKHTRERDAGNCTIWICRCDCGNLCKVSSKQLLSGQKRSCGCLDIPAAGDYTGRRFDALTVVGYAGRNGRRNQWRCRCDCGREIVAFQSDLRNGCVHSCGCLREAVRSGKLEFADGTVAPLLNCGGMPVENYYASFPGVRYVPETRKWSTEIIYWGETYPLGNYEELVDAVRARQQGEEMYGNFLEWYNRGRCTKKRSED